LIKNVRLRTTTIPKKGDGSHKRRRKNFSKKDSRSSLRLRTKT
jgi:hypothetical protein